MNADVFGMLREDDFYIDMSCLLGLVEVDTSAPLFDPKSLFSFNLKVQGQKYIKWSPIIRNLPKIKIITFKHAVLRCGELLYKIADRGYFFFRWLALARVAS